MCRLAAVTNERRIWPQRMFDQRRFALAEVGRDPQYAARPGPDGARMKSEKPLASDQQPLGVVRDSRAVAENRIPRSRTASQNVAVMAE